MTVIGESLCGNGSIRILFDIRQSTVKSFVQEITASLLNIYVITVQQTSICPWQHPQGYSIFNSGKSRLNTPLAMHKRDIPSVAFQFYINSFRTRDIAAAYHHNSARYFRQPARERALEIKLLSIAFSPGNFVPGIEIRNEIPPLH